VTQPAAPQALADLVAATRLVLLDFDGPVCSVFAGHPAPAIAERLRTELARHGDLTPDEAVETDPMAVLRASARFPAPATDRIEGALQRAESEAIEAAEPTPGADAFLRACTTAGLNVFVVTNNTTGVAWDYLIEHDLDYLVTDVFGRRKDPNLMKPNPLLLREALQAGGGKRGNTIMIGDSKSDIEAAQAAGVTSVGYANKPGKAEHLAQAGADFIVTHMDQLAQAVSLLPDARRPQRRRLRRLADHWPIRCDGIHFTTTDDNIDRSST
jgi:N-acetyl-D-muramate 6-phosphate phosphatase